jgi:hypothetical protein
MTAAAIDLDTLNILFDNQKKLDDIFDTMFDEDLLTNSSTSFNDKAFGNAQKIGHYSEELLFKPDDEFFVKKKRSAIGFVMPVVMEIVIIYYGIMLFI